MSKEEKVFAILQRLEDLSNQTGAFDFARAAWEARLEVGAPRLRLLVTALVDVLGGDP